jgi:hypothetical protein
MGGLDSGLYPYFGGNLSGVSLPICRGPADPPANLRYGLCPDWLADYVGERYWFWVDLDSRQLESELGPGRRRGASRIAGTLKED